MRLTKEKSGQLTVRSEARFAATLLSKQRRIWKTNCLKRSIGKKTVCNHQRRIQNFLNIGRMKEMPQIILEKGNYGEKCTQSCSFAAVMEIKEKV